MSSTPSAKEREVKFLGGTTIDGAPVAYVVVFAAVVTALSFIPFSMMLGGGTAFPLSQVIYPLTGIVLGPIAGAIASGIGATIAIFVAPHTAGSMPIFTVLGTMVSGFMAGSIVRGPQRTKWWIIPFVLIVSNNIGTDLFAILVQKVEVRVLLLFSIIFIVAWLLWILPTRKLFAKWIGDKNIALVAVAAFFITYMSCIIGMSVGIDYYINPWPNEVYGFLIPLMPVEFTFRGLVGAVIGTGVIAGLRAVGVVKPKWALY